MRTWAALFFTLSLSFLTTKISAGTTEASSDPGVPIYRVTSSEVHVAITAVTDHNLAVNDLSASDFVLLRDGRPVEQVVAFEKHHQASLSALVLSDVSDSMLPGLAMERSAAQWLQTNSDADHDRLVFFDFGTEVSALKASDPHKDHLTSLYDAALKTIPQIALNGAMAGNGRRALILLTDGDDNSSLHGLDDVIACAQKYDVAIYAITARPSKKQFVEVSVLERLTGETGGRFYQVRNPRQMDAAISEVNDELRNGYELVFRPDVASPGDHQLEIRSSNRKLRFHYRTGYYQPATRSVEVASSE